MLDGGSWTAGAPREEMLATTAEVRAATDNGAPSVDARTDDYCLGTGLAFVETGTGHAAECFADGGHMATGCTFGKGSSSAPSIASGP